MAKKPRILNLNVGNPALNVSVTPEAEKQTSPEKTITSRTFRSIPVSFIEDWQKAKDAGIVTGAFTNFVLQAGMDKFEATLRKSKRKINR